MSASEERRARAVAEQARETTWRRDSFLRDLFMGRLRVDLVEPFPARPPARAEFRQFFDALESFLAHRVDPEHIDRTGEYPEHVVKGLARLGAFGMKIPTQYGGLGLTHAEYVEVMTMVGSHDGNVAALLSAHQAIGVPQPILLFGTADQKRRFLPRCARGDISAFALTEPAVGSDPGRLGSVAELAPDGTHYVLRGEKLWCTNGTLAKLLVVMARNPATGRINAFVVETDSPGVRVDRRCRFMGLRALANAKLVFEGVRVPIENRIGAEGDGLKIALVTLNTGRLTLPAATAGMAKRCLEIMRKWANARVQWGVAIGKHEAVAHKIADATANAFAMEALAELVGDLADRKDYDLRLEAAAAKEWNTRRAWELVDETLQVRGGRGFETAASLLGRGEPPLSVERMLRDARVNLIFEGSSEIMHLFMAREAVDQHVRVAGVLVDPDADTRSKLAVLPRIAGFYAWWYPTRWLPRGGLFGFRRFGPLAKHLRFAERRCRRLARAIFHGMVVYGAKLEKKQAFLFRAIDVAMELFAMTATVCRAHRQRELGAWRSDAAIEVADVFARGAARRIDALLYAMWHNDDTHRYQLAQATCEGRHAWLEEGAVPLPFAEEDLRPEPVEERLARGELAGPDAAPEAARDAG